MPNEHKRHILNYSLMKRKVRDMESTLVIDGNAFYEIDEECMRQRKWREADARSLGRDMMTEQSAEGAGKLQRINVKNTIPYQ